LFKLRRSWGLHVRYLEDRHAVLHRNSHHGRLRSGVEDGLHELGSEVHSGKRIGRPEEITVEDLSAFGGCGLFDTGAARLVLECVSRIFKSAMLLLTFQGSIDLRLYFGERL